VHAIAQKWFQQIRDQVVKNIGEEQGEAYRHPEDTECTAVNQRRTYKLRVQLLRLKHPHNRGELGRLSPPANLPTSSWFTFPSNVGLVCTASHWRGSTWRGVCVITCPKLCSTLRRGVSSVRGHGGGSCDGGQGAGAGEPEHGICWPIGCPCSSGTTVW
jgi:hypothetical protein